MSETNSIFVAAPADQQAATQVNAQPVPTVQPSTPVLPDEVAQFVGEGKKYRSVEDALKSVPHAQTHISNLEKELAEAREKLNKATAAEELLEVIKSQQQVQTTAPVVSTDDVLAKVGSLVEQKMQQQEAAKIAQANTKSVVDAFQAKFGEKAEEQYKAIAVTSGLDLATLNGLAARSPTAVLKLAGIDSKQVEPATSKPASTINTEAFTAQVRPQQQQTKGIMFGATTADMVSAWKAARPQL